jgi:hypothetical protein
MQALLSAVSYSPELVPLSSITNNLRRIIKGTKISGGVESKEN